MQLALKSSCISCALDLARDVQYHSTQYLSTQYQSAQYHTFEDQQAVSFQCCGTSSCWSPGSLHWHHHAPVVCDIWPGVFSITVLSITELSMSVLGRCVQYQSAQSTASHIWISEFSIMPLSIIHLNLISQCQSIQHHASEYQ